jgi:glycerate 2-kinase
MFRAAVAAAEPSDAVQRALRRDGNALHIGELSVSVASGVHVVAVGKAAVAMARGADRVLGDAIVSGDIITKDGHASGPIPTRLRLHESGHPIPEERGERATLQSLAALRSLDAGIVVLALISGGGSALLEAPVEGVTLADLARTTDVLLRAGAPIGALNAVRAPLSRVKAGGLRLAAPEHDWVTLILSDVLGNDPRVIASGPTIVGHAEPAAALAVVHQFGASDAVPTAVLEALRRGDRPIDSSPNCRDIVAIIGDNGSAVKAAAELAREEGHDARIIWKAVEGEASAMGWAWVEAAANAPQTNDVLMGGGEATVTVRGDGCGGRNTEFALAAALELERRSLREWIVASLATDGQDALTGAAGAIADAETCQRARGRGIDPDRALRANDSLAVFAAAGGTVVTGPTGTNVNDIYIAYRVRDLGDS